MEMPDSNALVSPPSSPAPAAPSAASQRQQSPSNGRARSPPVRQLTYKKSAQERIDDILERADCENHPGMAGVVRALWWLVGDRITARGRAESLSGSASPGPRSPQMQPLLQSPSPIGLPSLSEQEAEGENRRPPSDSVVTTSQPERPQPLGYQSIRAAPADELRSRKKLPDSPTPLPNHEQGGQDRAPRPESGAREMRTDGGKDEAWWRVTLRKFQSIELENKGSVARDHLALERTFLAWLRTSLAFASIGIAITQLFRLNTSTSSSNTLSGLGKPLGVTFLVISIAMLFLGYQRYFESQQWLLQGKFPASRGTIILVAFVAFCLTTASLVVVVVFTTS